MAELTKANPDAVAVFTTACDQMRRAADATVSSPNAHVFLFNLPATWQTPAARRLYHAEVQRLGRFLEGLGGRAPTDTELKAVIEEHDNRRTKLREAIRHGNARQYVQALKNFFRDGSETIPKANTGSTAGRVPLAVLGGPLLPSQWSLFDAIESVGGCAALNAIEPGERCLLPPWRGSADGESSLAALADHYFDNIVDVFQRPNSRLYEWLSARLTERGVRGIVLWVHIGCDLWRAEAASLRETFGLPLLVLESHEIGAGSLRDTNRLAAFIESLQ